MIANTQANMLTSLLAGIAPQMSPVMGSAAGGTVQRFDLTLLEMTKKLADTVTIGVDATSVPTQVRKALETALANLAGDPEAVIQAIVPEGGVLGAKTVELKATLVGKAAWEHALSDTQKRQLDQLVGMALSKIAEQVKNAQVVDVEGHLVNRAIPALVSGPQGGSAEPLAQPTQDQQALPIIDREKRAETEASVAALAATLMAPAVVSTRTASLGAEGMQASPFLGQALRAQETAQNGQVPLAPKTVEVTLLRAIETVPAAETATLTPRQAESVQAQLAPALASFGSVQVGMIENKAQAVVPQALTGKAVRSEPANQAKPASLAEGMPPSQTNKAQAADAFGGLRAQPTGRAALQVEVISSLAFPNIVEGSEVTLSQVEQILKPEAKPTAFSADVMPDSQALTGLEAGPRSPLQATAEGAVQVAVVQKQVPEAVQTQQASPAVEMVPKAEVQAVAVQPAVAQATASADAKPQETEVTPQRVSVVRRWLSEGVQEATGKEVPASGQAPLALTRESLRDLAQSVAKEYSLRENVFSQALGAIEEAGQGTSQIRIQLRPESLGRLDVSIFVEGGKLVARLVASSSEVRDVFAANLPHFKQALEAQGLQVSQLSVSVRAETGAGGQGNGQAWDQALPSWNLPVREGETPASVPLWAFAAPAEGSGIFNALA